MCVCVCVLLPLLFILCVVCLCFVWCLFVFVGMCFSLLFSPILSNSLSFYHILNLHISVLLPLLLLLLLPVIIFFLLLFLLLLLFPALLFFFFLLLFLLLLLVLPWEGNLADFVSGPQRENEGGKIDYLQRPLILILYRG